MTQARILVVEDERIVALDLQHTLESFGHEVVATSPSGERAVELARVHQPDLILMDINLEGKIDGTEAAEAIQAEMHTPIIFLTAYTESSTLARAEKSAPYGYLVKPVETRALQATLRMAMARSRAERRVRQSEERLRIAMEAADLGVWEWDAGESEFHSLGSLERILGALPDGLSESPNALLTRLAPADREAIFNALERGEGVQTTVRLINTANGGERPIWIDFLARFYTSTEGVLERAIGAIRDVTERQEAEAALKQASLAFESIAEGIVILDTDRRIIMVNDAFTRLTGYTGAEVEGQDLEQLLLGRRPGDAIFHKLDRAGTDRWHGEIAARRANGKHFQAWMHVCSLTDADSITTNYLVALSDVTALRESEALVRHQAQHDALTGLGNRNMLSIVLARELERQQHGGNGFALIFIDLDGFKLINDTMGHDAGDHLLVEMATRIRRVLRTSDTCVRLGGDEFLIVAPEVEDGPTARLLADKVLASIREPLEIGHEQVSVSGSIGIALCPEHALTAEDLIKAADSAMYSAKALGRNRARVWSLDMAQRAATRLRIEQGLLRAIANEELFMAYQPVVDIGTGMIIGVEALMRWTSPTDGVIDPGRFIPVAEDCGLMEYLGTWALRTACEHAQDWIQSAAPHLRVAVNVSARQFQSGDFPEIVARILDDTRMPANQLELEITESVLQQIEQSREQINALKHLGVHVAIDDFGTGYSSLSVLKHLAIDRIKIDRSFVKDLPDDPSDVGITEAIIALASALKVALTAEGVETEAQRDFLAERSAMHVQGWLYYRAETPERIAALLASGPQGKSPTNADREH